MTSASGRTVAGGVDPLRDRPYWPRVLQRNPPCGAGGMRAARLLVQHFSILPQASERLLQVQNVPGGKRLTVDLHTQKKNGLKCLLLILLKQLWKSPLLEGFSKQDNFQTIKSPTWRKRYMTSIKCCQRSLTDSIKFHQKRIQKCWTWAKSTLNDFDLFYVIRASEQVPFPLANVFDKPQQEHVSRVWLKHDSLETLPLVICRKELRYSRFAVCG